MEHFTCLVQQNQGFEVRKDTWCAGDREETLLEGHRDSFVSKRSLLWTLRSERFQLSGEAADTSRCRYQSNWGIFERSRISGVASPFSSFDHYEY